MAVLIVPLNLWYIFPAAVVEKSDTIALFPQSKTRRSKYEHFREAWPLLS